MRLNFQQYSRHNGATMVEYGLIGALVMVFCITVVQSLGGNLNGVMLGLKADLRSSADGQGGDTTLAQTTGTTGFGGPGGTGLEGGGRGPTVMIGRTNYQLPAAPQTGAATTGAMGSDNTTANADYLRAIAQQLQEQGEDPALVGMITDLANKSHALASVQNGAEGMCYNAVNCTGELGKVSGAFNTVMAQWENVQGALNSASPELANVIAGQVNQMSATNNQYASEGNVLTMMYSAQPVGSTTTTANANTICASGGSNCTQSSPDTTIQVTSASGGMDPSAPTQVTGATDTDGKPSQTTGTLGR